MLRDGGPRGRGLRAIGEHGIGKQTGEQSQDRRRSAAEGSLCVFNELGHVLWLRG